MLLLIILIGYERPPINCADTLIKIENRYYRENGGRDYLEIKNKDDIGFICNQINNFSEETEATTSYHHGYLTIYFNDRKIDMIFTVNNRAIYCLDTNKSARNEAATRRIMKLMYITDRCRGNGCQ